MIKRGIVQLGGSSPKFRISRRGVDVDAAGPADFLIHENYLVAQPFHTTFVDCPFAGNTGNALLDQTVSVTIPNVTANPVVLSYIRAAGGYNSFPTRRGDGQVFGRTDNAYAVYVTINSATSISVRFLRQAVSLTSPDGVTLVCYRQAS